MGEQCGKGKGAAVMDRDVHVQYKTKGHKEKEQRGKD